MSTARPRETPPHDQQVAMTNNFHIRMKNAINRVSARPRPTSSWCPPSAPCGPLWLKQSGLLDNNPIFRTLSFSDGCSRFFSRLWSVSRRKRLTLDDMGPNMGPPFGRRTAEKRLELKIYMGYTMAHEFGEHIQPIYIFSSSRFSAVSLSTPAIYSTYLEVPIYSSIS